MAFHRFTAWVFGTSNEQQIHPIVDGNKTRNEDLKSERSATDDEQTKLNVGKEDDEEDVPRNDQLVTALSEVWKTNAKGWPERMFGKCLAGLARPTFMLKKFWENEIAPLIRSLLDYFKPYCAAIVHIARQLTQWVKDHPDVVCLIMLGIILTCVFQFCVAPALLTALGFGAMGPVAGTFAAFIQSLIGNVGAGSLFAILQSAAMGGFGVAIVSGVVVGGGAAITAALAWWALRKAKKDQEDGDDTNDTDGEDGEDDADDADGAGDAGGEENKKTV